MSLLCKYMPFDLADGRHWDTEKGSSCQDSEIIWRYTFLIFMIFWISQCLTPLDIERIFGMTRGDILHGRLEPQIRC